MKTNNKCAAVRLEKSKLVAALAILAVAFVVIAAVPAVDATGETSQATSVDPLKGMITNAELKDGAYDLSNDAVITLTKDVTLNDIKFTGAYKLTITSVNGSHFKLDVNYDFKTSGFTSTIGTLFDVKGLVLNGADLTVVQKDTGKTTGPTKNAAGCSVFGTCPVEVEGKSTLKVTTNEYANRVFYNNGSSLKITGAEAKVILEKATSSTAQLSMSDGATLEIKDPLFSAGNFYPNINNDKAACSITVSTKDGDHGLFFYGSNASGNGVLKNCNVKSTGIVGFYSNGSLDASGSTIEAAKLVVAHSISANVANLSNATLKVGEIAQAIDPNNDYKAVNSKTLNLSGVSFIGNTTVADGVEVKFTDDSFINAGAKLTINDKAKVSVESGKKLYNGGTIAGNVTGTDALVDLKKAENLTPVSDETVLNKYLAANAKQITYSGTSITGDVVVLPETKLVLQNETTIIENATFDINGTIQGSIVGNEAKGTFSNFTGDFTIKAGSVIIDGTTFTGGTYTATAGVTKISGTLTGELTLNATAGVVQFENFVVYNTGALTLVGTNNYNTTTKDIISGFCVAPEKSFDLYGEVTSENGAKIDVQKANNKSATFRAYSGAKIVNVDVIGAGKIDLSKAQSPQTVGEDISYNKTYGQLEDVTIVGSLTIKNNAKVEIKGGFQVNEGVTLTIEKGSELIINSSAASMIIDGRIVVEEEAKLTVTKAMDVKVSGSIESEGTVSITSTVTIKSGGSIVINDATVTGTNYASTFTAGADLTVEAGAELIIKSKVASNTTVTNKGTVTLDGAILNGNFTVKMAADKAVVQILNVQAIAADRTITVTDNGLKFADKKVVGTSGIAINEMEIAVGVKKTGTSTDGSSVTVAGYAVKGLTVVETVSSETDDNGDVTYYNTLDLAGTVSITSTTDNVSISGTRNIATITGERIAITGDLTLGKYVGFIVNGKMSVSGKFVATEENSKVVCDTIVGVENGISVSGLVQVVAKINNISAAMYEGKVGTTTVYNYTTLKAAIDSGAKDIAVTGIIYVAESVTVPAGVTVKNEGTIVIGSDEDTEVVLTVADSASIKNGTIDVKGTLYFENKKNNKVSDINSDVSVIGGKDARYTNLYTALTKANPGDTVTVDGDKVVLKKSITIKDGVTLDVPLTKHLVVDRGITISVIGTLKTAHAIEGVEYTLTDGSTKKVAFDLEPSVRDYKATIIVSGVFMSMEPVEYDGTTTQYKIPGAYYKLTDDAGAYNYVTTLENASKSTATKVDVYGKVTAGDVSFIGTSAAKKTLTVATGAELAASSITLDKAGFTSNGKFSGDVKVGDSAVTAKLAGIIVSIDKDGMLVVDNVWRASPVSSNEEPSFKVSAGTVKITGARIDITVSEGATLVAADETNLYRNLIIDGTVLVDNGKVMTVAGDVTVNGTLTVAGVTDTKEAGTLTINDFLYVGVTDKDTWNDTGADASVSGAVAGVKVAFVKTGANISEATLDSFKVGDVLKSTTYVVEDKDWMTVYSVGNLIGINFVDKAPVKDAEFNGVWKNVKGDKVTTQLVGDKDFEKVTADVKYDIYTILVNPAAGIESIAVDGNLMQVGMFHVSTDDVAVNMQMYFISVKAGTHDITCKLANGYSGEAKFTLVDDGKDNDKFNASLTGNKLTVSGDAGTATIQITGVSASGYVDPVVPEQKETEDGLSLTDILLIVLVVLIVIMAIIVAMRLMRS